MAEELLINVNPFETRVALVTHGLLQEIHVARAEGYSVTGNIYLGKVERIVPGMQAAFVNIGLHRPGFLHARDIDSPRVMLAEDSSEREITKPDIRDLLHDGQTILVQVEKDPISTKGARLSTQLALASKYLVLMPNETHVGISQRIEAEEERDRLRTLLSAVQSGRDAVAGVIARTAAENATEPQLANDFSLLERIWARVLERSQESDGKVPRIVYEELPLHSRMVRELVGAETETIFIDEEKTYQRIRRYVDEFIPSYAERLHFYDGRRPLFERHGVEDEVLRALDTKVALRSGGSLVIEQTEAMISIDVNTGGFLGGHNLEETVYRVNLEAAAAIPRQLRLRNLGGIIVIDFIDMEDPEHQRLVLRALEKAVEADPARTRIEGFSALGLVQMSRKRTRESLAQIMCAPCPSCQGNGLVRTAESTCVDVLRALAQDFQARCRQKSVEGDYLIRATESVVDRLLDEDAEHLTELSQMMDREVRIQMEPSYQEGQFDIVLVQNVSR
ncbi:MAG: Rne/Rng family ribonuclease [Pseudomonadales bacterium]|nr:Rne/Rng family ribonuclease [Pseudomonadales bacterium]